MSVNERVNCADPLPWLEYRSATLNNEKALGWQSNCGRDGNLSGGKPSKPLSSCAAKVRSLPRQLHSACWLALQSKFVTSASASYNPAVADKPVVAPRTRAAHPRQLLCLHGEAAAAPRPATHAVRRMLCFSTNPGSWLIRDPPLSEGQGTVPGSRCYCCCFSAT